MSDDTTDTAKTPDTNGDTASSAPPAGASEHRFEAEVSRVLHLVVNSLYKKVEIFLRELLSNASDALDKQRFAAVTDTDSAGERLRIRIVPDDAAGTLTIDDNGVGMSADELTRDLGTIARSGTEAFAKALAAQGKDANLNLIGQFGVGFYSAFLVADRVEVVSRTASADTAYVWRSDGHDTFTVAPAEGDRARDSRGTAVILHMRQDHREFLQPWRLRELVSRYSDYIGHPIEIPADKPKDEGKAEAGDAADKDTDKGADKDKDKGGAAADDWQVINQANALWQRPAADITDDQYDEFYRHLTRDWEAPLARKHFRIEGTQLFTGLLFVPRRAPFDLFYSSHRRGIRLHVKRVLIMDDCEDLVPPWLRFVRGVIDSEDLPLNVSRETLQDSAVVRTIRKQVIKHTLDMLASLAADRPADYATFWGEFGAVLKEGLHYDPEHASKLAELVRYETSVSATAKDGAKAEAEDKDKDKAKAEDDAEGAGEDGGLVSLATYADRMPEGQPAIYYALGNSLKALARSPHLEALRARGYEVLFMTDTVDQWAVEGLREYRGKPLVSATTADLKLDEDKAAGEADGDDKAKGDADKDDGKDDDAARPAALVALIERFEAVLGDRVESVRASRRLTDSPVCLVVPEGGLQPHIERLLRAQKADMPAQRRILELNPDHAIVGSLRALTERDPASAQVADWIELLYEQALLAEGSPAHDPARVAAGLAALLERAAADAVSAD